MLALLSSAEAATPVTPDASPEAKALLNYLYAMKGKKTLSGQMWAPWGIDEIKVAHDITGKYPALRGQDYIHQASNENENKLAIEWWKAGGIPTIMWHWGAPGKGEGYEQSKMAIEIDQCFVPGTPEHTAMWADLKRIADQPDRVARCQSADFVASDARVRRQLVLVWQARRREVQPRLAHHVRLFRA